MSGNSDYAISGRLHARQGDNTKGERRPHPILSPTAALKVFWLFVFQDLNLFSILLFSRAFFTKKFF